MPCFQCAAAETSHTSVLFYFKQTFSCAIVPFSCAILLCHCALFMCHSHVPLSYVIELQPSRPTGSLHPQTTIAPPGRTRQHLKRAAGIPRNLSFRYILFHEKKKSPNDAVTPQWQSQFTPKMKANAESRLLSSLE